MNLQQFLDENYTVLNGEIISVSTKLVDSSRLVFSLIIRGDGWGCNYGEYDLFDPDFNGKSSIVDLMETIDVETISDLVNKNIRIAIKDTHSPVRYIGNIIYDKWFSYDDYREPLEEPKIDCSNEEELTNL